MPGVVPGWALSLVFHGVMLVTLLSVTQLPSCRGDYSGEEGTGFREIGLRVREDANSAPSAGPAEPGLAEVASTQPQQTPTTPSPTLPRRRSPSPPSSAEPATGRHSSTGSGDGTTTTQRHRWNSGSLHQQEHDHRERYARFARWGRRPGKGVGQTSLFGANDAGKTFVYVIDRSASMRTSERSGLRRPSG